MDQRLEALEKEFTDGYMAFHPCYAAFAGIHDHDLRLEDVSAPAIEAYCRQLDGLRRRIGDLGGLSAEDEIERGVLLSILDGTLCEYRTLRHWQRDPYFYAETLCSQLNTIVIFDYAPLEERLRTVVAKQRQIPRFLEAARRNLQPTAPILVDYGIRGIEGALSLIGKELPAAFASVKSPDLRRDFESSTGLASGALESFLAWLKNGYGRGDARAYALGEEAYGAWLAAREQVTEPLQRLEAWALEAIDEHRDEMQREASRFESGADPASAIARITSHHPATGKVVEEAARVADEVYQWVEASRLVTFPSRDRVLIADTPAFMRWSFGSMWTPGPYEKAPVRATFYATDADPSWPEEQQREHLTAFCYRGLENLAIHEAYPGHFIQTLHQNRVASPLRKTFWWGAFGEGWAHYCELMAVEEGFGGGAADVRILQLQEALNRLCRFVNGIRLHTRAEWDFVQGTRFFRERAWLAEAVARAECERAAFDPFYLRYTLGKKEILEVREECRRSLGDRFDLRAFHDALLSCGAAPMPSMRALTRLRLGLS